MKKKILVIGTGGTIASVPGEKGLVPEKDVSGLLAFVPQVHELCDLEQIQLFSLDSTNVGPKHWRMLAECIREHYKEYDGFLILHGTDTMAYTAAALSYLIQNSPKPIVLTGSQLPMEAVDTDAKNNIYQSICYATGEQASDVVIVFAGKVIPGARARKVKSQSMDAFATIGGPDLAVFRTGIEAKKIGLDPEPDVYASFETVYEIIPSDSEIYKKPAADRSEVVEPEFYLDMEPKVIDVKITPGLNLSVLLPVLEQYEGIVLEGFGLGGLPEYADNDYFSAIQKLTGLGKTVAVTTQVSEEGTDMSVYEVGKKYRDGLELLEGRTMTPEAMTVKLMWILAQTQEKEKIRELFYKKINYDIV